MKKLVLIFRRNNHSGFSVEELFHSLSSEFEANYQVVKYELRGRQYLIFDIINLWKLHGNIYHVTGDVHYVIPLLPYNKTVLTVLDIGHLKNDLSGLKKIIYKFFWYTLPVKFASQITVISKKTFDDVLAEFHFDTIKLSIVACSYGPDIAKINRDFNLSHPNILQVGTHKLKNISRVAEALEGLPCKMTIIGKLDPSQKLILQKHKISFENYYGLSRADLLKQYEDADLVIFTSLEEGFGIPVLEAQAAGKPLVTSSISPMSDNAGLNACLVDPYSVSEIKEAVYKVINDSAFRTLLINDGLNNVRRFSNKNIAIEYIQIYKRIV